jgi:hypothetical protein
VPNFDVFDAPLPSEYEFTLGGRVWHVRHKDDIPFRTVARMRSDATLTNVDLFKAVLLPEEGEAMEQLLLDPPDGLTRRGVDEASRAVYSYLSGFPTPPAAPSSPGPRRTPRKSAAGSSSRARPKAA